ncbi:MAG TPA: hypothetical protein VG962_03600 [Steroidobacteraceae bacterium]|nr:hypothetical protein [Steroidobacteraceae bacterium]
MFNVHFKPNQEVDEQGLDQLRHLEGEFRRSTGDRWFFRLVAFIPLVGGLAGLQAGYQRFRQFGDVAELWFALGLSIILILPSAYLMRRAGYWYRFVAGKVQLRSGSGKILWEENLAAIESVSFRSSRSNDYLILHWADAKHYIEIYNSLESALTDPGYLKHEESGQEAIGQLAGVVKPVISSWICKHCGEDNPGEFEVCWKCQFSK